MMTAESPQTLFVVDDEPQMRTLLAELAQSANLPVELYASADEFLAACDDSRPGCLVADVCMPGMDGLELLTAMARSGVGLPVILITAHADVPMAVQAMKAQAVDFLEKPFENRELLNRVDAAFRIDADRRADRARRLTAAARIAALTRRERQIMDLVIRGAANKQMAHRLDLSIKTIEAHRGSLMRKLQVQTVAELVRLAVTAGIVDPPGLDRPAERSDDE